MVTFYNQLTAEKKRKIREQLEIAREKRLKQLEILERTLIKPIKQQIEFINKVKKSEIPIEHYLKYSKKFRNYIEKWFNLMV